MNNRTIEETVQRLLQFREDLKRKNVSATPKLDQLIQRLRDIDPKAEWDVLRGVLGRNMRELTEANQLIDIAEHFLDPGLIEAVPATWKMILRDESDIAEAMDHLKTGPRNFQYELWLAAEFRSKGITAKWSNRQGAPDVLLTLAPEGGHSELKLAVEAKRPNSIGTVGKNINEALKQLNDKLVANPTYGGFVAVSLDLLILDPEPRFARQDYLDKPFHDMLKQVAEIPQVEAAFRYHPRVLGVMFTGVYPLMLRTVDGKYKGNVTVSKKSILPNNTPTEEQASYVRRLQSAVNHGSSKAD